MGLVIFSRDNFSAILESWSWSKALLMVTSSIIFYVIGYGIYNIYFHPLAKFPGPKFAAISNIFYARTVVTGASVKTMAALHEKYGEVVRWAPNELSFSSAAAWKDIYTPHKPGAVFLKDPVFYIVDDQLRAKQITNIPDHEEHEQARKMFGPAFSPKALSQQQDIVLKYVNMLMIAIQVESRKGPINLVEYYNWVTSDVLGELAFGESFGSVKNRKTDSWIATLLQATKFGAYDSAIHCLSPLVWRNMHLFLPSEITEAGINLVKKSRDKVLARMERGEMERRDFCSYLFDKKEEFEFNDWNLAGYASTLIMAGSETTATAFCGLTYYLCRTPEVYEKLKDEVRGRFKTADEITSHNATFPYLTAVIHEALRIYPPVPIAMPRVTPKGGAMVAGVFVPEGAVVGVHSWSVTHNPNCFKDPYTFRPERWLDPKCTDDLSASQPFLLGARNCIGQNMAWMELRILVAKMVFLFDFELVDDDLDWDRDGLCFRLWQKPDLWTKVTIR
ncbi:cytochrome P450 [Stipitochalara longipes BDJ]|nr:cytochrome P450 [Stipitochalara longipes BDJ]